MSRRQLPNIIITGTPGCGKTSHAEALQTRLGKPYKHYSISDLAKSRGLIESYDETLDTSVVKEDELLDSLEPELESGAVIIDWHVCDIFPERLVDLVVVLRTDNSHLYDRMVARGYKDNKIQENLDAEIMEVILQEAQESYNPEIVVVLTSNLEEEKLDNVDRISQWISSWVEDHPTGVTNEFEGSQSDESSEESEGESGDSSDSDEN
ncbi:factor activating pos9 [Yamadazyma tenuis]|uniref:Adenylate kinase isoenzyme 6 homolog n=1 Tax=Candida tenuis (strain ATCC 10573 / BCRC 21748 / CBS 615 / JCM 9827 / NBRC 10315 / NRRL Y-1498 / VKM Y-70) TaxID=590646 RepID=G3BBA7_CANTC|nr:P-loop containing nucleoside triphosphate hydrolase protein [Yamadazyma tenuis ATCC 10573]EGV61532.1 P-loop containing nucleoside triphosphate hydrolase protein [Yamadazyma tenuis ATCC 10573]WEJ92754.1 factor activating pos9 [Yamadazyma tenuis]